MTTFKTTIQDFGGNLWGLHMPVPEAIARLYINGNEKRVLCTVEDNETWHAALMPSQPYWFIMLNQARCRKLNLVIGQTVNVKLEKDESKYGMEMPEEFKEMLNQDPSASTYFEQLTAGKKRTLIHLIASVKNTQSRINKALAIAHHLNEVQGNLNFKILNQTIKEFNQYR
jgi:hypothetical protein